jgi:hypothetical protein
MSRVGPQEVYQVGSQGFSGSNVNANRVNTSSYVQGPVQGSTYQQVAYTGVGNVIGANTAYGVASNTYGGSSQGAAQVYGTVQKAIAEEIPVESRIEYIPFEKKYIEYDQIEKVYSVPFEREIVEYEEVVHSERVPIERTVTDYYAVETQVEYIRREIEETIMVEQPVEKVYERVQYIPVETQIVHYPERDNYVPAKGQIQTQYIGVQGQTAVQGGQVVQGGQYSTVQGGQYSTVQGGYQSGYQQSGSRVGATYGNVQASGYQTGSSYPVGGSYTTGQQGYTTGQQVYTTGQQGAQYGYQQGGQYVSGGSRVGSNQYVTGGSGVRGNNTYVTGGSGVKQGSFETSTGYYNQY